MSRRRNPLTYILFFSFIFYTSFIYGTSFLIRDERYFTLVDDAMISMRYARNLSLGHGFEWNIGGPRIEGFTNLGWTLYMAFVHLFPIPASKISLVIMLTSATILLADILFIYRLSQTLVPGSGFVPLFSCTVVAFYFPLVFWSLRGMEVGLLVLLVNIALWMVLSRKNPLAIGLILLLAIVVRMDAAIPAVILSVYYFFKRRGPASIVPLVCVILTVTGIFYFQRAYFGDFLPITYYQKVSGFTAWSRIRHGLLMFNEYAGRDVLTLLLFSVAGLIYYRQFDNESLLLLGIFLAQCLYSVYVGGDYAEPETNAANRFVTQGMPALIVLFGWIAGRVLNDLNAVRPNGPSSRSRFVPAAILAMAILAITSGEPWFDYAIDNAPLLKADIRRVKLALHIKENTDPRAVIAVHAAGQIPYFSERTVVDLLGLNDPVIAKGTGRGEFYPGHNKWNYDYSITQLKPDLIADNFAPLGEFMKNNDEYELLESDIYVRRDSQLVNIEGISSKDYR